MFFSGPQEPPPSVVVAINDDTESKTEQKTKDAEAPSDLTSTSHDNHGEQHNVIEMPERDIEQHGQNRPSIPFSCFASLCLLAAYILSYDDSLMYIDDENTDNPIGIVIVGRIFLASFMLATFFAAFQGAWYAFNMCYRPNNQPPQDRQNRNVARRNNDANSLQNSPNANRSNNNTNSSALQHHSVFVEQSGATRQEQPPAATSSTNVNQP